MQGFLFGFYDTLHTVHTVHNIGTEPVASTEVSDTFHSQPPVDSAISKSMMRKVWMVDFLLLIPLLLILGLSVLVCDIRGLTIESGESGDLVYNDSVLIDIVMVGRCVCVPSSL